MPNPFFFPGCNQNLTFLGEGTLELDDILGRKDLAFDNSQFSVYFWSLNFQISRFPDFQTRRAWVGLGFGWGLGCWPVKSLAEVTWPCERTSVDCNVNLPVQQICVVIEDALCRQEG